MVFRVIVLFLVIFGQCSKNYSKTDFTIKILTKNYAARLLLRFVRLKKGFDMVKYIFSFFFWFPNGGTAARVGFLNRLGLGSCLTGPVVSSMHIVVSNFHFVVSCFLIVASCFFLLLLVFIVAL